MPKYICLYCRKEIEQDKPDGGSCVKCPKCKKGIYVVMIKHPLVKK